MGCGRRNQVTPPSTDLRMPAEERAYRIEGWAGLIATPAMQPGPQLGIPRGPVSVQVAPSSVLLKMPLLPGAYQTGGVLEAIVNEVGYPAGRLASGVQDAP